MKKLFVILIISLVVNPVMAIDFNAVKQKTVDVVSEASGLSINTNLKQKQAEKELKAKIIDTPEYRFKTHIAMLQEDKLGYENDMESLYGDLIAVINKNSSVYTVNTKYAQKAKVLFDEIVGYTPENSPTLSEFDKKKIIISDNDFDKIDENLKEIIFFLNLY